MNQFRLIILLLIFPAFSFSQDPQSLYNKANTLYQQKNYAEAVTLYDSILKSGYQSADLYFNLGNAYFKLQKYPESILNYERARRIAGNKEDIVFNIALANMNITDKIDPINQLWITEKWGDLVNSRASSSWGVFTLIILWISLIMISAFNFISSILFRRIISILFIISFLSFMMSGIITYKRYKIETNNNYAIVFTPTVYVKSAPDAQSTDIFIIHAGLKVEIIEKVGEWYQVRLADGKKGWMTFNNLEII